MFDRGFFLTSHAVRRQLAAMPNDFYLIRLIHGSTRRSCPNERLWDRGLLVRGSVLRFLRARNLQGFDVYLLPYADYGNAGYILLDLDHVTVELLPLMRDHGHEPCVVLQTSLGHLQAWIRVSLTPLQPAVAALISKQLARAYGGDLASTGWCHLGRLAGFTNQKLARRAACGSAPWVKVLEARPILASAAQDLLGSAMQAMELSSPVTLPQSLVPGLPITQECTITPPGAVRIYRSWMQRWHIQERFAPVDWSIIDLWLARKLLAMHIPLPQVEAILRLGSPNFPRHHSDPEDYLRRTLARAALSSPPPVCSTHAAAPALPTPARNSDCSNSTGGR